MIDLQMTFLFNNTLLLFLGIGNINTARCINISVIWERLLSRSESLLLKSDIFHNSECAQDVAISTTKIFTSGTVDRSASLGPSTLQTFLAHRTARVRRLDSILAKYRVDLKIFCHHIAI